MGLLDDILAEQRTGGVLPILDRILRSLNKKDRDDLLAALNNDEIHAAAIARALTKNGHRISQSAVKTWRQRNVPR